MKSRVFGVLFLMVLIFGGCFFNIANTNALTFAEKTMTSDNMFMKFLGGTFFADQQTYLDNQLAGTSYDDTGVGEVDGPKGFSVWFVNMSNDLLQKAVSEELYNDVFFSDAARAGITKTWEVVRGLVNMFYLLILLFLAITTILRVNKFSDKKLFFNVIISAVLVNFSLVITLVVIDFSNLVMTYFASAISDVSLANSFFQTVGYTDIKAQPGILLQIGMSTAEFIINIIMGVMLLFTAVALLVRLIAYWVLMILSPLAFFAIAIPGSNGFNEWKDKLVYYSFFGPIMLFFIWLAVTLSYYLHESFINSEGSMKENTMTVFMVGYITVIYLLYYGHEKSKGMAGKAGDFTGKIMNKGGEWATKAGKGAATFGVLPLAQTPAGKSLYQSGSKAVSGRLQENKYTKWMTKKGREDNQSEQDFKAEYKLASAGKRKKMEIAQIGKTEAALKEKNFDMKDEDALEKMLNTGSIAEKRFAAAKLAENNTLKGDRYTKALKVAGDNELLRGAIDRGAGKKNKYAQVTHHAALKASGKTNEHTEKYMKSKLKGIMTDSGFSEDDINSDVKRDEFVSKYFNNNFEKAVTSGTLRDMKNKKDIADFINEDGAVADHAVKHFSALGRGKDQLSEREREGLFNSLGSEGRGKMKGILLDEKGLPSKTAKGKGTSKVLDMSNIKLSMENENIT